MNLKSCICRAQHINAGSSFKRVVNESFQARTILGGNEICATNVGPADAVRPVVLLLDFEEIDRRVEIARLDLVAGRNE